MACCGGRPTILNELKDLVCQIGDCCGDPPPSCPAPCYPTMCQPFAQVTMVCPPPILAPTRPEPVEPLRLPCPPCCVDPTDMSEEQADKTRYANFYNNYNEDWHNDGTWYSNNGNGNGCCCPEKKCPEEKNCEDYQKKDNGLDKCPGCPTGFKPCTMRLRPSNVCDPCAIWCAQVQPCPPKPRKKKDNKYEPGCCTRPCCKHYEPKEGPCLYDDPCKAHCFNHPPGMKPSGRFP